MKRKCLELGLILIILFLEIKIIGNPKILFTSVNMSFSIWKNNVFPTLFIFLLLGEILISLNITEYIKKVFYKVKSINYNLLTITILGILSGTPGNVKFTVDLLKNNFIDSKEAERIICLTHFMNPLFIIGTIGYLFLNDVNLALIILFCHYFSNFILIFIIKNNNKYSTKTNYIKKRLSIIITNSINNSIRTCLIVLGTIVFYNLIIIYGKEMFRLPVLLNGVLEVTSGIKSLIPINTDISIKISFITGLLSFGGISIHTQVLGIINDTNIRYKKYLYARLLQTLISIIMCYIIYNLFY